MEYSSQKLNSLQVGNSIIYLSSTLLSQNGYQLEFHKREHGLRFRFTLLSLILLRWLNKQTNSTSDQKYQNIKTRESSHNINIENSTINCKSTVLKLSYKGV